MPTRLAICCCDCIIFFFFFAISRAQQLSDLFRARAARDQLKRKWAWPVRSSRAGSFNEDARSCSLEHGEWARLWELSAPERRAEISSIPFRWCNIMLCLFIYFTHIYFSPMSLDISNHVYD